jgi:hypothetical protein
MGHPFDPSWCARINARPAPSPEPVPAPPPAAPAPEPMPLRPLEVPQRHVCDLCGAAMYEHNCKIVCPNCGYRRDCTDP